MAESLGTAKLTLAVDDAQFRAGLQRAELSAKGAGAAISQGLALAGVSLGAAGLLAFAKSCADAGLAADAAERRLTLLAGRFNESAEATQIAARSAQQLGVTNQEAAAGIAELYGRLRPLGLSLDDIDTLYTGLSAASKNLGLDAASTAAGITQLAQGLGTGSLQGDNLLSVLEQLPPVAQAVAQTMGVSVGQMKNLGSQGKITNDIILTSVRRLKEFELGSLNLNTPQQKVKDLGNAFEGLQVSISKIYGPATIGGVDALTVAIKTLQIAIDPNAVNQVLGALQADKLAPTGVAQRISILTAAVAAAKAEFLSSAGGSAVLAQKLATLQEQLSSLKNPKKPIPIVGPEQLNTIEKLSAKINTLQAASKKLDFGSNAFQENARQIKDLQQTLTNATADRSEVQSNIVSASREELIAAADLVGKQGAQLTIAQTRLGIARQIREVGAADGALGIARRTNDPDKIKSASQALQDSGDTLRTAMITGAEAARQALKDAALGIKDAFKSLDGARKNAFDLLPDSRQNVYKEQAIASIQRQMFTGELDRYKVEAALGPNLRAADPQKLLEIGGKADAIAEASKALMMATQDQTKATIEASKITAEFNKASATLVGVLVNAIVYRQPPQPYLQ